MYLYSARVNASKRSHIIRYSNDYKCFNTYLNLNVNYIWRVSSASTCSKSLNNRCTFESVSVIDCWFVSLVIAEIRYGKVIEFQVVPVKAWWSTIITGCYFDPFYNAPVSNFHLIGMKFFLLDCFIDFLVLFQHFQFYNVCTIVLCLHLHSPSSYCQQRKLDCFFKARNVSKII